MKRILIDGTFIRKRTDGLSQYTLNILRQLAYINDRSINITLLLIKDQLKENDLLLFNKHFRIEYVYIPSIGIKRDLLFNWYLYKNKNKYDIIYFPSNQYPLFFRGGIYTVHDIIYEKFPQQLGKHSWLKKIYLHLNVNWGINNAKKIIAISNYTKNEILAYHKTDNKTVNKIHVIYEGWEHLLNTTKCTENINLPFKKYIFYVGSSRGHKNLTALIKAFQLASKRLSKEWGLIITGKSERLSPDDKNIIASINSDGQKIFLTEWVSDEALSFYFKNATGFIFPSLSEGFGIPILEAFYYNVPILCSNNTVFPEIAKDAAFYFDPTNIEDISNKIVDFSTMSKDEIERITNKGKYYLQYYSWEITAKKILKLFLE